MTENELIADLLFPNIKNTAEYYVKKYAKRNYYPEGNPSYPASSPMKFPLSVALQTWLTVLSLKTATLKTITPKTQGTDISCPA